MILCCFCFVVQYEGLSCTKIKVLARRVPTKDNHFLKNVTDNAMNLLFYGRHNFQFLAKA